jgi:hypothetical protein
MNLVQRTIAVLVACVVPMAGGAMASPAVAATKPGVVVDYGQTPPVVKIRPATIWPFSDIHYTAMHWTRLTSASGRATAVQHINTCVPSCADANYRNDKVQMSFSRVRRTSTHRLVFTRVRVTVIKTRKSQTLALPQG